MWRIIAWMRGRTDAGRPPCQDKWQLISPTHLNLIKGTRSCLYPARERAWDAVAALHVDDVAIRSSDTKKKNRDTRRGPHGRWRTCGSACVRHGPPLLRGRFASPFRRPATQLRLRFRFHGWSFPSITSFAWETRASFTEASSPSSPVRRFGPTGNGIRTRQHGLTVGTRQKKKNRKTCEPCHWIKLLCADNSSPHRFRIPGFVNSLYSCLLTIRPSILSQSHPKLSYTDALLLYLHLNQATAHYYIRISIVSLANPSRH